MSSVSPFLEEVSLADRWIEHDPGQTEEMLAEASVAAAEDWEASDALVGAEPWAETSTGTHHPITQAVSLPGAVLDTLAGGLAPLAVSLAASAGHTDVDQLTNIVFFFRHPEMIGRRIEPGQRTLAEEWISIRERIVRPALSSAPMAPAPMLHRDTVARPQVLSSSRLVWPGHSDAELAFMRAVYDRQARDARGDFVVDLPEEALDWVDGRTHRARKDAAAAMTALLAEARAALAVESPNKRIGVISAYRPASRQFAIWQGREPKGRDAGSGFPHYYRRATAEKIIIEGDHSAETVEKMARFLRRFIASPGYSNHQDGLAFDLGTNDVGNVRLIKLYKGAWFHNWLKKNAKRFRFRPLADEPWHWTYEPAPQSELEGELGEVTTPSVRPGRLEVRRVPMLAAHRGSPPDLILRWNQMASVPERIDVVVHLHGYWYTGMRLPRDIEPVSGLDLVPVEGATGGVRSRPTLTILPRGHDTGIRQKFKRKDGSIVYGYNAMTFPVLVAKNGLANLVRLSLDRFAAAVGGPPPRVGRLVLTAHSGGGKTLLQLLEHHDPHQIHIFDALYWSPEPLERWARRRIERDKQGLASGGPDYMATQGGALRVFYQGRTKGGTTPSSRRLQAALAPLLDGELAHWYRVEASAYDHFQIPRRYGWRLLVDVAADVPDARVAPLEREAAGELEEPEAVVQDVEPEPEPELEALEPPPLNALPEPASRASREVPSESEAALWESEEDRLNEASARAPFGDTMAEDALAALEDGRMQLALAADEEPERLSEGVDLSGEQAEPEPELEVWDSEP